MIDGRFDQHFAEIFAASRSSEDGLSDPGLLTALILALALAAIAIVGLLALP